jgi:hypothetical protein
MPSYALELENFGFEKVFEYKNVKVLRKLEWVNLF